MSFRLKLFLSIVVAVIVTALVESSLDFLIARNRAQLQAQTEEKLQQYLNALLNVIELGDDGPRLVEGVDVEAFTEREARFRIMTVDGEWVAGAHALPESEVEWARLTTHLEDDYHLDIALERTLAERIVNNQVLMEIVDLPLFFALAFAVAWLLTRLVMRPVRELTQAFEQISTQHFPEPVEVPNGSDELSQMAHSFNLMSKSIQELLERERAFTRYASHELRTPLSALKMQVERAEMGLAPAEAVMPVLERNILRMEEILTVLLALSRASERDLKPTLLRPLVQELLATFPPQAKRRLTLHDKTLTQVEVTDARLVFQALYNLIENALRYSDGPVEVTVEARGKSVSLSVRDTGPGVPEELLGKLTKPFFRAGKHSKSLGLGLALVENIARSLKGTLKLRNANPGLEATLNLPIAVSEEGLRAQKERWRHKRLTTSSKSG